MPIEQNSTDNHTHPDHRCRKHDQLHGGRHLSPHYFTVGCGNPLSPGYYLVWAESADSAREVCFSVVGTKWSMQYRCLSDIHPADQRYLGTLEPL